MNDKGLFVVIEGSDGAGKATQLNLLKERLKATGYDVAVFDFPQYSKESSYFVRQYLNGQYGSAAKVSPYTASLFYALDRYEAAKEIRQALADGKIVLSNRYTGANMAHQGGKFSDPVEQRGFFVWADNLEFQLLDIPRPDINFFLRVPAAVSAKLIKARADKTGAKLDEHEKDSAHLKNALKTYDTLCQLFPKDFKAVECTKNGELMSIPEINNLIWNKLKPLLPAEKPHPSHSVVVTLDTTQKDRAIPSESGLDEIQHVFKDASLILRLALERTGRLQISSVNDRVLEFYTPVGLPKPLKDAYRSVNAQVESTARQIQEKLVKYLQTQVPRQEEKLQSSVDELLLPLTPLSMLSTFAVKVSKNDIEPVASSLLSQDSEELQWAGKQLYLSARKQWPKDFEQPLESQDGPVSLNNIIAKLAEERLPHDSGSETVKLLEARPRLEFDLLAESIYPYSNLSLDEIGEEVSNWPYSQKFESLKEAASQQAVLKKVRYKMDVLSDQVTLNKILAAGQLKDVQVQAFTPRYGYDVPELIEQAGVDDLYDACFDEYLKLYSLIQGAGREDLAPYATLLGHKVRWQLNLDGTALRQIAQEPSLQKTSFLETLSEKISEVHPLLWEIIKDDQNPPPAPTKNGKNRVKAYRQPAKKKPRKRR
jgi:dTMP kinase